jgi:hypothetical protein
MPIYQNKLDAKLNALLAKDTTELAANHVYLPFLGSDYTAAQADAWLTKRISRLQDIDVNKYSDVQIEGIKTTIYNQISTANKYIADKILAGGSYEELPQDNEDDYDRLVALILIMHVTTP